MKALISTKENIVSETNELLGLRVCDRHPTGFDVSPSFFWVDCPSDLDTTTVYWDGENLVEIPNKELFVFIHIPKTGGQTVKGSIGDRLVRINPNEHSRWRDIDLGGDEPLRVFSFVRNPWDRVASQYLFGKANNIIDENTSFEQFVEQRVQYNKNGDWLHYTNNAVQQIDYVVDGNGELRCDILRTEMLGSDLQSYLQQDIIIQNENMSDENGTWKHKDMYDDTTRQMVEEQCADDIEFFGFEYDGSATKNIWES